MSDAMGRDELLSYSEYLRVPELLEQQLCLADPPAHDELQFIVVHQVYELWFKLVLHELDATLAAVDAAAAAAPEDERPLRTATRLARRVVEIFKVLVQQIHVLETMRPVDFLAFRKVLKPASGFQSAQFRQVECMLGLKSEELVARVEDRTLIHKIHERMAARSLPDALYELMQRRGFAVHPPNEQRSDAEAEQTIAALRHIYEDPDAEGLLHDLCETLMDVDEQVILWRRHHVMMVERQIGGKPGTGKGRTGELDGIRYLQTTLMKYALPDLWAVRTHLDDDS